jgi:hypothetical protein
MTTESASYPIGRFHKAASYTRAEVDALIARLDAQPAALAAALGALPASRWDAPYRDGGWTVRQVVHHMADSHAHFWRGV